MDEGDGTYGNIQLNAENGMELAPLSFREIQAQGGRLFPCSQIIQEGSNKKRRSKKSISKNLLRKGIESAFPTCSESIQHHPLQETLKIETREKTGSKDTIVNENMLIHTLTNENQELKAFLRDILYTLNARGYESVSDPTGVIIDLNRCRGEKLLTLKGRDARIRLQGSSKRIQAHEHLLKAVIGSQERLIQTLANQLKDAKILPNSLKNSTDGIIDDKTELVEKCCELEKELVSIIQTIEAAIQRSPSFLHGLKDQLLFETRFGRANPILSSILEKYERAKAVFPQFDHFRSDPEQQYLNGCDMMEQYILRKNPKLNSLKPPSSSSSQFRLSNNTQIVDYNENVGDLGKYRRNPVLKNSQLTSFGNSGLGTSGISSGRPISQQGKSTIKEKPSILYPNRTGSISVEKEETNLPIPHHLISRQQIIKTNSFPKIGSTFGNYGSSSAHRPATSINEYSSNNYKNKPKAKWSF